VKVSKHDELDTYLPAFRAAVTEGHAGSVMCSYNSINGEPACANHFLLEDQLRGKWGFQGYVVSDCDAVRNIFNGHHFRSTQPEASAISLQRGMDNECIDANLKVNDDHDYRPYLDAVHQGFLKESEIDVALIRLFTARIKLGMFDPPEMVPYSKIDEKLMDSAGHRAMARKLANESMVLLKNDGVLPLRASGIKIAVVGPLADQTSVLLGNYNGMPSHTVSVLEGLRNEFPGAAINYVPGTQFLGIDGVPVPASALAIDGKPGIKANYSKFDMAAMMANPANPPAPLATRVEQGIDLNSASLPAEVAAIHPLAVRWEAALTAPESGDYNLGLQAAGLFRVQLDGKGVAFAWGSDSVQTKLGRVHLEAGKPAKL
jgi:beta-glucosidase